MNIKFVLLALIGIAAYFPIHDARAYTISLSCNENPAPPPTLPYQNVLCIYGWAVGGDPDSYYGEWQGTLTWWGTAPPTHMDYKHGLKMFDSETSPFMFTIVCSDVYGSFRLVGVGTRYKEYWFGDPPGPIGLVEETLIDDAFTYISALVTCGL